MVGIDENVSIYLMELLGNHIVSRHILFRETRGLSIYGQNRFESVVRTDRDDNVSIKGYLHDKLGQDPK